MYEPCNFESGILISDFSDHFLIFFNRKNFFCTNSSKNVNKGVRYRLINQNTLSALDEMLALTNFDDIINNINNNEATQLLFNKINNTFKLRKFQQFKGDCKSTWKQINSIIRPNRINKNNIINKSFVKMTLRM